MVSLTYPQCEQGGAVAGRAAGGEEPAYVVATIYSTSRVIYGCTGASSCAVLDVTVLGRGGGCIDIPFGWSGRRTQAQQLAGGTQGGKGTGDGLGTRSRKGNSPSGSTFQVKSRDGVVDGNGEGG